VPSYSSAVLFHGPGARAAALRAVHGLGRLLHSPFGEEGLKIAESREIIDLMNNAPVGDRAGVIVVGPLDRALPASTDVLLKSIEEFNPDIVRPVLWANDETEVSTTIRSRCLRRWCPGQKVVDEDVMEAARQLVTEALGGHRASVVELLNDRDPRDMLVGAAQALNERGIDDETEELWERVRATLCHRNPTATEALAAFL
jgi:hypothetical protein